jgi:multicomponent Na+:H+ antiporter subunit E
MNLLKIGLQYAFFSVLIGVLWVVMTNQPNLAGFVLGFVLGYGLLIALRGKAGVGVELVKVPRQLFWTLFYALVLTRDILISGWDVSLRILGIRPIKSGILKVAVGDKRDEVAALTAHGITITPGQLVVEFDSDEHVYVHCLNIEESAVSINDDQAKRLKFYRGMLGDDMA